MQLYYCQRGCKQELVPGLEENITRIEESILKLDQTSLDLDIWFTVDFSLGQLYTTESVQLSHHHGELCVKSILNL